MGSTPVTVSVDDLEQDDQPKSGTLTVSADDLEGDNTPPAAAPTPPATLRSDIAAKVTTAKTNIAQYPENQAAPDPDYVQRRNAAQSLALEPGAPEFQEDPEQERRIKAQQDAEAGKHAAPEVYVAPAPILPVGHGLSRGGRERAWQPQARTEPLINTALQGFQENINDPLNKWGEKTYEAGSKGLQKVVFEPPGLSEGATDVMQKAGASPGPIANTKAVVGAVGGTALSAATDPRMAPILLTGPETAPALRAAMTAGFTGQMAYNANEQATKLGEVLDNPDVPEDQKWETGANAVISAIFAGHGAAHPIMGVLDKLPPMYREEIVTKLQDNLTKELATRGEVVVPGRKFSVGDPIIAPEHADGPVRIGEKRGKVTAIYQGGTVEATLEDGSKIMVDQPPDLKYTADSPDALREAVNNIVNDHVRPYMTNKEIGTYDQNINNERIAREKAAGPLNSAVNLLQRNEATRRAAAQAMPGSVQGAITPQIAPEPPSLPPGTGVPVPRAPEPQVRPMVEPPKVSAPPKASPKPEPIPEPTKAEPNFETGNLKEVTRGDRILVPDVDGDAVEVDVAFAAPKDKGNWVKVVMPDGTKAKFDRSQIGRIPETETVHADQIEAPAETTKPKNKSVGEFNEEDHKLVMRNYNAMTEAELQAYAGEGKVPERFRESETEPVTVHADQVEKPVEVSESLKSGDAVQVGERTGNVVAATKGNVKVDFGKGQTEIVPAEEVKPAETKYKFGSTQINIAPESELGKAHAEAVKVIKPEHIHEQKNGKGVEEQPHVTVRYGLKDTSPEHIAKIGKAVAEIPKFEVPVGKTTSFNPSESSEGAAPLVANLEKTPELEHLRNTVEGAGDFREDTFPEYKPHISLGYVKPEFVHQYEGRTDLKGHKVPVHEIAVTDREGNQHVLPLGGEATGELSPEVKAAIAQPVETQPAGTQSIKNPTEESPSGWITEDGHLVPGNHAKVATELMGKEIDQETTDPVREFGKMGAVRVVRGKTGAFEIEVRARPTPEQMRSIKNMKGKGKFGFEVAGEDRHYNAAGTVQQLEDAIDKAFPAKAAEAEKPQSVDERAAQAIKDAGMVDVDKRNKGENVERFSHETKGTMFQVEHPDHPGKTFGTYASELQTPEAVKDFVNKRVETFEKKAAEMKAKEAGHAVPEFGAGTLLQREQEKNGASRGERGRVESGQQGKTSAEASPAKKEVATEPHERQRGQGDEGKAAEVTKIQPHNVEKEIRSSIKAVGFTNLQVSHPQIEMARGKIEREMRADGSWDGLTSGYIDRVVNDLTPQKPVANGQPPADNVGEHTEHKEAAPEGAPEKGGRQATSLPLARGHAGMLPVSKLTLDPKRFQYKLNTDSSGTTNLLKGQTFNPDLAGVVQVWHDPADGKTYVVNGHHRVELAQSTGQKELLSRHIDVPDAESARAVGAMTNIAEGRGTAVDAAKFMREKGITPADLKKHGISMGEATAENGLALSKLDPYIFDKVVSGDLSQGRGIAIGKATDSPSKQEAVVRLIDKAEKRGRKITDGMVAELARFAENSGETTTEEQSLFGATQRTESHALDKAEVSDYVRSQITKEKRLFGSVASESKAQGLARTGNKLNVQENQRVANEAGQAGEIYDKLSSRKGPIDDVLENSAKRIAKGESATSVKADAYNTIRTELTKALAGPEGRSSEGSKESPEEVEPALPGMQSHIEAQKESAAETAGEDLSRQLAEPKPSISAKTGKMERESPLFRDSSASGQDQLFSTPAGWEGVEPTPDKISFESLPKEGHFPPILTISTGARRILAKAGIQSENFGGVRLDKSTAAHIAENLMKMAGDDEGVIRDIGLSLKNAADSADKTGVVLIVKGTGPQVLQEELAHAAQAHLGKGSAAATLDPEAVKSLLHNPIGEKATAYLWRNGYNDATPSLLVAEIAAKIAIVHDGITSILTPEEAASWYVDYLNALMRQHGTEAPKVLAKYLTEEALKLYDSAYETALARAELEASLATAGGQEETGGGNVTAGDSILPDATGPPQAGADGRDQDATETKDSVAFSMPPGGQGKPPAKFEFPDKDIQEEFDAARGLEKPSSIEKVKEAMVTGWHKATRTYEHLPRGGEFEQLRFNLKSLEKAAGVARDKAANHLQVILGKLDKNQYYNFSVKVILDDLLETAKDGLDIPFFDHVDQLAKHHAEITAFVAGDAEIQKALKERKQFWNKLKADYTMSMEAIGFKLGDRLSRENYYRHQVLQYATAKSDGSSKSKLRTPTSRGHLKARHGSDLPINTDYLQAEHEVMAHFLQDIETAKTIKFVHDEYDISEGAKRMAVQYNESGILEYFKDIARENPENEGAPEEFIEDQAQQMKGALAKKQAAALGKLKLMAAREELPVGKHGEFRNLVADLAHLSETDDKTIGLPSGTQKQLIPYAKYLLEEHGGTKPGSAAALLFKGMAEKRKFIKDTMGKEYMTWKNLIPEDYKIWQPREGSTLYFTKTVPEHVVQALQDGAMEQVGIGAQDLRNVRAQGQRFKEYAIPENVAETLDNLRPDIKKTLLGSIARPLTKAWKIWELSSPRRFLRFRLRHISGQAESMFVGNPAAFKQIPAAASEVWDYHHNGTITPTLQGWLDRGGSGSSLLSQEVGAINNLKLFKRLHEAKESGKIKGMAEAIWQGYWKTFARGSIDTAESIMRYAAYRSYLEQMTENVNGMPDNYGASRPDEVKALKDRRDRAWKMANDLLGAYDDITEFGRELRGTLLPFWSFTEINAERAYRFFANAGYESPRGHSNTEESKPGAGFGGGGNGAPPRGRSNGNNSDGWDAFRFGKKVTGAGARKAPFVAFRIGKLLLKMSAFWALVQTWNLLLHRKEWEELSDEDKAKPVLILGRDKDGNVLKTPRMGSIGELLGWFGLDAPQALVRDWLNGDKTTGEVVAHMAESPPNKVAQSVSAFMKMPAELMASKTTFPDVFHPHKIRDKGDYLARMLNLENEIKALKGEPTPGYWKSWQKAVFDNIEEGQNAYYDILQKKADFLEKEGKPAGDYTTTPKGEALRNMRLAAHFGDEKAMERFLGEYLENGGSAKGLRTGLKAMNPLNGLSHKEKIAFVASLNEEDQNKLSVAMEYYLGYLSSGEHTDESDEEETPAPHEEGPQP